MHSHIKKKEKDLDIKRICSKIIPKKESRIKTFQN